MTLRKTKITTPPNNKKPFINSNTKKRKNLQPAPPQSTTYGKNSKNNINKPSKNANQTNQPISTKSPKTPLLFNSHNEYSTTTASNPTNASYSQAKSTS